MQVTIGLIIISVIQLFTMVSVVYMCVYLHMVFRIPIGIHGLLLTALLSVNLMLLTQRLMGKTGFILPHTGSDAMPQKFCGFCCVLK